MGERTRELFVLIAGDIIIFVVSLWLTLFVRYLEIPGGDRLAAHIGPFSMFTAAWLLVFYIMGLYDKHTNFLKNLLLSRIAHAQIINVVLAGLLFFIIPFGIAPKTNLVLFLVISTLLLGFWRFRLVGLFAPQSRNKAILIADGAEAIELVDEINNNDRYGYSIVRMIDNEMIQRTPDVEGKLLKLIEREGIDIIVADSKGEAIKHFLPTLFDLSFLRFSFTFVDFHRLYEDTFDRVPVTSLQYDWFISNISQSSGVVYDSVKRTIDVIGAIALIIPAAVLFPFIALAIKLDDRGALFYTTQRIGRYNKPITIYKFRTKNGFDSGAQALNSTLVDTKIGAVLRKTRIDELPQLLNVLWGDLSFIGPRPEIPELAAIYAAEIPHYNARHLIKPGLSGWAQIGNFDVPRGGVDVERTVDKLSFDLFYLKRRSFILDVQIALKTLATILMRTGS
jgi:lipopolysaccharide/colanic/teichoic acid biosynthesis glycosyltransferase